MRTFDVIVAGLGGMGSAAAYSLASRGRRVLGLDRYGPVHDLGSSHGKSRIIRQAYFESPAYVPLLLRAYELWRGIEHDSGLPLLTITGGLMIGTPESAVVAGSLASARAHALPHEVLDAAEIRRRHPALRPASGEIAVYERAAGFVHPELTMRAYRERAAALGATLQFDEPVISWSAASDRVTVRTTHSQYEAESLVITAGPWAPELLAALELPLTVERQVLYWFEPRTTDPFRELPIWIWEVEEMLQLYGFPLENDRVKTAFYHEGSPITPETVDREVHENEIARVRRAIAPRVPTLDGRLAAAKTCLYTSTPDHHFVIDLHPLHRNVVIASPCSGHGFKFVPVIGEILSDLALEGATRHPIEPFRMARFAR
jgi:sarcosine oxidase